MSAALASSTKTTNLPRLSNEKNLVMEKITYIESQSLRYYLERIGPDQQSEDQFGEILAESRHISVYLFSFEPGKPVLVDRYYQSRALRDTVIAVQSDFPKWESNYVCNDKQIYWNLRNPVKSMLSSTALVLGNLMPPHLGYSGGKPIQDWSWSVGDSPLSVTSAQARFSSINRDTVLRNFVVHAIDSIVEKHNAAVHILEHVIRIAARDETSEKAKQAQVQLAASLQEVALAVAELQFDAAFDELRNAQRLLDLFSKFAVALESEQYQIRCKQRDADFVYDPFVMPIAIVLDLIVFSGLFFALRRRSKRKLKVN
jgi:hypothetical protein